ncbi:MAG: hypothetical protein WBB96_09620, partial [Candidatus Dechloromonas phosphoritropha]
MQTADIAFPMAVQGCQRPIMLFGNRAGFDPQPSHDIGKPFGYLLNTKPPLKDFKRVTLDRPD